MFPGTPASSHSPKTVSGACIIEIQLQNGKILIEILIQLITVNSFREILRKNGSAVDAAIAALLCTSIINPQSAGIGGGSIFTIMDRSGKVTIINSRETVPSNVTPDLLKSCDNTSDQKQANVTDLKNWNISREGNLTLGDLASYEVKVTEAWNISLGDYMMYFPPPPAGGAILSLILNIMKGYKINKEPNTTDEKTLFYHRYIEALKFANGLRKRIGDPKFDPANFTKAKNLTEDNFADCIRSLITNETHAPEYYGDTQYVDSKGTTHVSVLAEDGSAVSVTSSINDEFGSKVLSPSTGIILNNQLSDFCGRRSNISPGERPPSSMAPAVLKSQSKMLVIGGAGSTMITTGIASALINHLWFNKSLEDAIKAPVFFVDSEYDVMFEPELTQKDLINSLKALGHNIAIFYNVVNAVEKEDDGCISAWSDERKKGKAAGY
ncbi:glutathione hydrolase 5 proenzyme isoform X3 [Haplochromis burtoni]|uniref:glutathione hydrolase 5 proenzyme isoform X3 n=1 Tax=Haplochromis burtoni TaxID=8153 RepID=UPI001C2CEC47|nr:glutathione hydrolase 5 proenzyme isoform X3 [Haplochromis burtoni]